MEHDLGLINDLNNHILRDPKAVQPLRLLIQIYDRHGNSAEAAQTAKTLLEIDRRGLEEVYSGLSPELRELLDRPQSKRNVSQSKKLPATKSYASSPLPPPGPNLNIPNVPQKRSSYFHRFSWVFGSWNHRHKDNVGANHDAKPHDLVKDESEKASETESRPPKRASKPPKPRHVKETAEQMAADPPRSLDTAINDLSALIDYEKSRKPNLSDDELRTRLVARTNALAASIHPNTAYLAPQALMHITHECLSHTYTNDSTMVSMDPLSSIPRSRFFASEDNYAWDMSELAAALHANQSASLRNPLSRAPFTEADVTAIVHHPLGRGLAAVRIRQTELRRGVRQETVRRLETLAKVLLEDDEESMQVSRGAMDDFAAYVATLPRDEREALNGLRCPATDRHTGVGYDASVGDMLRDAKANQVSGCCGLLFVLAGLLTLGASRLTRNIIQVCGHKAGDFLSQAARYLKNLR